jgi:hypothetical protein
LLRQRHEVIVDAALMTAFAALLDVAARGRWGSSAIVPGAPPPRAGLTYAQQRGKVLRRGKVVECLRPVSLRLHETLLDPPCCVHLRLVWRLEPTDVGSNVVLEARFSLNGAAMLRRKHWSERIAAHCMRMQGALRRHLSPPTGVKCPSDGLVFWSQET